MTLNPDHVAYRPLDYRLTLRNRWGTLRLGALTLAERIGTAALVRPRPARDRR
ncbi:hypothetical protein [Micromonospora sonneratiae]|jgi:hypothetical protein|uniref:Uncharacterized protein n=1 Tax=Micromonospora sonneratiae TaxID=1184706 RepID=A0ABW3YH13_9ACTN